MNSAYTVLSLSTTAAHAAQIARERGCGLYITRRGQVIVAPQAKPGWQRIGVRLKAAA